MGRTQLTTRELGANSITRDDLDTSTTTKAIVAKLVAGTNVTFSSTGVDAGTGDVTINSSGGSGLSYTEVTGTTQALAINSGYILNNAGLVIATLPSIAAVGSIIIIVGKGIGGWKVAQNASQIIHFGNLDTLTGTGGSIASNQKYDCVELICIVANNEWVVRGVVGNLTVTYS